MRHAMGTGDEPPPAPAGVSAFGTGNNAHVVWAGKGSAGQ